MAKPLSFKEFTVTDRPQDGNEQVETEALDVTQRRKRAQIMKRNKAKIAIGRRRAERKIANMEKLKKRARKHARNEILKRLTKDIPKAELSVARKKELEKRLEKPVVQKRIARSAKKMLPSIRKAEMERKRNKNKGEAK